MISLVRNIRFSINKRLWNQFLIIIVYILFQSRKFKFKAFIDLRACFRLKWFIFPRNNHIGGPGILFMIHTWRRYFINENMNLVPKNTETNPTPYLSFECTVLNFIPKWRSIVGSWRLIEELFNKNPFKTLCFNSTFFCSIKCVPTSPYLSFSSLVYREINNKKLTENMKFAEH